MTGPRLCVFVLTVLLLSFSGLAIAQTRLSDSATCRGDIDEDGRVTVFDLLEMLKVLPDPAGKPERVRRIADTDASGRVDIFDLLELLKYLSGSKTPPTMSCGPSISAVSSTAPGAGDTLDISLSGIADSQTITVLIDGRETPLCGFSAGQARVVVPDWFCGGELRVAASGDTSAPVALVLGALPGSTRVIFLHHSTGENVWNGGVADWFAQYGRQNGKSYSIGERAYPSGSPYPWNNYPYDYWNIWVSHAGAEPYLTEPTLEILTPQYRVIVFKHCYPVSGIGPDTGSPSVSSEAKTLENYKLQYAALKEKLHQFRANRFIVWTGAALVEGETNAEQGARAREFFEWVKTQWDEPGDNIFVWDFFELETEGGLYLKNEYASGDSHPNAAFCRVVAPLFGQRVVDVIEGRGDSGSLTGKPAGTDG
ncbi:dockerin type I repeat-containing protein [bacterium]|nr:dockerin type I repeat-containing protein [bacterium]